jgi:outer membrane murein-binding lipoprotein Lpp
LALCLGTTLIEIAVYNIIFHSSNSFDWISAWNISILASFAKAILAISEARNQCLKSEVQSLKSEVRSLKSDVWSLKSEVRSLKSEVQNKNPYRRATYIGSFEASVLAHVALRMLADTLHRWVTLLLLIFILSVWSMKSEVWSPKSLHGFRTLTVVKGLLRINLLRGRRP